MLIVIETPLNFLCSAARDRLLQHAGRDGLRRARARLDDESYCAQLYLQLVVIVMNVIPFEEAKTRIVLGPNGLLKGGAVARDVFG